MFLPDDSIAAQQEAAKEPSMIAADSVKNLKTGIVLQASGGESPFYEPGLLMGAGQEELGQFIDDPEVQQTPDGKIVIVSMRNQCVLAVMPTVLACYDASGKAPARRDFAGRVAQIAEHISNLSRLTYDKVGISFDIESKTADEELPSRAMLRRLVRREALKEMGYDVVGAAVKMWYVADGNLHSLQVEPKDNEHDSQHYHAHLSVEFDIQVSLLTREWLLQTLNKEYLDFLSVLDEVLESSERGLS